MNIPDKADMWHFKTHETNSNRIFFNKIISESIEISVNNIKLESNQESEFECMIKINKDMLVDSCWSNLDNL